LNRIIEPKAGETIVVSAASGAVGGVVGQLAKLAGCRAVGIAGGREKCDYVVDELKLDACIDYKVQDVGKALKEAAPQGVDGYFENVGGEILDAVLPRMNAFGRIALCGLIAGYNAQPIPIRNPTWLLISRLKLQGFIVSEHMEVWPQALKELGQGVAGGRIRYRETVAQGLQSAPEAFIGLLKGRNFGKQLVRLA
jgi:NADPH-dependent curcumin reductase CurA